MKNFSIYFAAKTTDNLIYKADYTNDGQNNVVVVKHRDHYKMVYVLPEFINLNEFELWVSYTYVDDNDEPTFINVEQINE